MTLNFKLYLFLIISWGILTIWASPQMTLLVLIVMTWMIGLPIFAVFHDAFKSLKTVNTKKDKP